MVNDNVKTFKGISIDGLNHMLVNARYWDNYALEDIKTINGESIISPGGGNINIASKQPIDDVTYSELVEMKKNNKLIPGQQYRIIDYETTTSTTGTQSAGHKFDIIVTSVSGNALSEIARTCYSDNDVDNYFKKSGANLNAWKIWYSLDNDTNRFAWCDKSGKGVIYRMIDEWNNDCPYDFKNIQFKRKVYKDKNNNILIESGTNTDTDLKFCYTFSWMDDSGDITDGSIFCNNGSVRDQYYHHTIGIFNNTINVYNHLGYDKNRIMLNNIVFFNINYHHYVENIRCHSNVFDNNCYDMTFGGTCYSNIFGVFCYNMIFGNECYSNVFARECYSNTFGNNCSNNTFGNGCYDNTFGDNYSDNTFGNNCYNNILGNRCYNNIFNNNCIFNKFEDECYSNTLGYDCIENNFGERCYSNSFGNNCYNNNLGNGCYNNNLGNGCCDNIFGIECYSNSFGNDCVENNFGNECNSNSLFNRCSNNTLGKKCINNSFGNGCSYNSFRITNVKNGSGMPVGNNISYVKNVHFGDGAIGVIFYVNEEDESKINEEQTVQNVTVSQGLKSTSNTEKYLYIHMDGVNISNTDYDLMVSRTNDAYAAPQIYNAISRIKLLQHELNDLTNIVNGLKGDLLY